MNRKYDAHFKNAQILARQAVSDGDKIKWQTAMVILMMSHKIDEMMKVKL